MILLFVVHLKKKTRDKVSAIYDFKYFEWYLLFKKKKREIHACSFVQLRSRSKRFREGTRNEVYEFSRHRAEFRGEINGDPWLRARTFLRCEGLPRFSTAGRAEVFFLEVEMCRHFERPCFRALFDWLCFIIELKGSFVRIILKFANGKLMRSKLFLRLVRLVHCCVSVLI